MTAGFHGMAVRERNAAERFIQFAMSSASLTRAEAVAAMNAMRRFRMLKLDAVDGQFHLKHGAYGDADVLRRASTM